LKVGELKICEGPKMDPATAFAVAGISYFQPNCTRYWYFKYRWTRKAKKIHLYRKI